MSGKGRTYPDLATRLAQQTDMTPGFGPNGDCWEWRGYKTAKGYGQIGRGKREGGRVDYAHRVAYEVSNGVDIGRARKNGPLVLHSCDNPSCVNPAHLFLGDDETNVADMKAKGRWRPGNQKGEANPGSKLKEEDIRKIRAAEGSLEDIAARFDICPAWAWQIRNGSAWSHI